MKREGHVRKESEMKRGAAVCAQKGIQANSWNRTVRSPDQLHVGYCGGDAVSRQPLGAGLCVLRAAEHGRRRGRDSAGASREHSR